MGAHRDSLPNGRNPSRREGGPGRSQNSGAFMEHQLNLTPGGQYGHRMEYRRTEAKKRAKARADRTPEEQIALLDKRLGVGVGAMREREKLQAEIDARTES